MTPFLLSWKHQIRWSAVGMSLAIVVAGARAATFVVPPDRDLIRRADAIVVATALDSYVQRNAAGGIETVSPMSVEEVIKDGSALIRDAINVVEPGGRDGDHVMVIPGAPRFEPGERLLLLLIRTGEERWSV